MSESTISKSEAPTASTAAPSSGGREGGGGFGGGGNNSSLYLVTFLATLFLLLFVSCAIVLRSYILRRRYQRRLEEAMAAGLLLAPRTQGSKRKRFGTKPKIFDTWITEGGDKWHSVMPVAAQPVFVKRKYKEGTGPKAAAAAAEAQLLAATVEPLVDVPSPTPTSPVHSGVRTLIQRFKRQHEPPTPIEEVVAATPATATTPATPGSYKVRVEMLQVFVLISMPTPTRSQKKNNLVDSKRSFDDDEIEDDSEEPLPELVFGVTRVNNHPSKPAAVTVAPPTPTCASTAAQTPAEPSSPPQTNFGSYF